MTDRRFAAIPFGVASGQALPLSSQSLAALRMTRKNTDRAQRGAGLLPLPLQGKGVGGLGLLQSPRADAGFTLIELMLAIGLLAVILAMLAGSFNAVAHSKVHAENRLDADHEGRILVWQLSREIRGLVQTPLAPSRVYLVGEGHTNSSVPLDAITLSTLDAGHRRSFSSFGPEDLVSYAGVPNSAHRGWFVIQRTQRSALLTQPTGADSAPLVLADNVLALHIRYFDGTRWNETWDSRSLPVGRALPLAISIELQMAAPGGQPMYFATQVSVPMGLAQAQ